MESFMYDYKKHLQGVERFKEETLDNIVTKIKVISVHPVILGNMVFFYMQENGKDVPAYCYLSDYNADNPKWLPVYDRENTGEFGWSNFEDCCRIFDTIVRTLRLK